MVTDNVTEKGKNGWGGWEGCKTFFFGVIHSAVRKCFGTIYHLLSELCVLKNCQYFIVCANSGWIMRSVLLYGNLIRNGGLPLQLLAHDHLSTNITNYLVLISYAVVYRMFAICSGSCAWQLATETRCCCTNDVILGKKQKQKTKKPPNKTKEQERDGNSKVMYWVRRGSWWALSYW